MKKTLSTFSIVFFFSLNFLSNALDAQSYVRIGDNMICMSENLNVDRFKNGDPIPYAKTNEEWKSANDNHQPAWCYYDGDESNGVKYGRLYNFYAVADPRGLAPYGWHIPTDYEWESLIAGVGGRGLGNTYGAVKKMKSQDGWKNNNNGTNESGFNGLPGGQRKSDGEFVEMGEYANWWTSRTIGMYNNPIYMYLYGYAEYIKKAEEYQKGSGKSVRCIKD